MNVNERVLAWTSKVARCLSGDVLYQNDSIQYVSQIVLNNLPATDRETVKRDPHEHRSLIRAALFQLWKEQPSLFQPDIHENNRTGAVFQNASGPGPTLQVGRDFRSSGPVVLGTARNSRPAEAGNLSKHYPLGGDVFISYRQSASQQLVERLADKLVGLSDAKVFLDRRSIGAGVLWDQIEAALRSSRYFLPVISVETFTRRPEASDWLRREYALARKCQNLVTIPLLEPGVSVRKLGELPVDMRWVSKLKCMEVSGIYFEAFLTTLLESMRRSAGPA